MLIHPAVDRLRALGLAAMADTFVELQNNPEAAEMPHADWLGLLVDREVTARNNRRLARRLSSAKLRQAGRRRERRLSHRPRSRPFAFSNPRHLPMDPRGQPPGHRRSNRHRQVLACLCARNKACRDGFSVLYKRAPRLFAGLAQARGEGRLARLIAALERVNLLILDDWGPEPLTADQRRDLLEIVDDRNDKGSLLITSQVSVSQWHDVIADPTLGDAILDRIIHNAHRIELKGDNLRRQAGEEKKP
ncbi:DNA replication protein DnaC [Bradyrhizobium sp. F1.2.2]